MRISGRVGAAPAPPPTETVNATFPSYKVEEDWTYNALPLREDMFRWNAKTQTVHEKSANVVESIRKCASETIFEGNLINKVSSENFGVPIFIGQSSDPEVEFKDKYTNWPKFHVRTGAEGTTSSDHNGAFIDAPTGRVVEPGELSKAGNVWTSVGTSHGHDMNRGCGYSANRTEKSTLIPFPPESAVDKARAAGGTVSEAGGSSSARIVTSALTIRFAGLKRATENWEDAIQNPLGALIQGALFGTKKGGQAPRTATPKYGYGIVGEPSDGRLPYIYPAHQGEVAGNGCTEAAYKDYAPPNGCWTRLNWSKATVEGNGAPNWVKAIQWAWCTKGAFLIDVGGAPGWGFYWQSPTSFKTTYASAWLSSHEDGVWLKKKEANWWKSDITGSGLITAKSYFDALEVLVPPTKPADLSS